MHRFNFIKMLDAHMVRPRIPSYRSVHLYPSEASVIDIDGEVHGKCLRAIWYRLKRLEPTNPPNARNEYIFRFGEMIEAMIIAKAKEMGLWVDDHVKFYNEELHVSGELDIIIRNPEEPDQLIICEVKSFYGWDATKQIMGNFKVTGFPKYDQLLQAFTYVDYYKDVFAGCKMIYVARDSLKRREFNVEWDYVPDETGGIIVHPSIDGKKFTNFSMQGMNERYRLAWEYYTQNELPPRDYQLYYSVEEMAARVAAGLVCKTNAEGFKKSPDKLKFRKASWHCSYCSHRDRCWHAELYAMEPAEAKLFMVPEEAEGLEDAA